MKSQFYLRFGGILLVSCLLLLACKSENAPKPEMSYNYFPLKIGSEVVYKVDSTVYNFQNPSGFTFAFQLKDLVIEKFTDAQGNEAYKIERYKKTSSQDWTFQKIVVRKIANARAEEVIDNRRYVRLVFPPSLQSTWNGNAYNDLGAWKHEVEDIDVPLTIGANKLDSTIAIQQYNEVNLIREDIYNETYAKNIGLVIKEVKAINKNISTGVIRDGFRYRMELVSWK